MIYFDDEYERDLEMNKSNQNIRRKSCNPNTNAHQNIDDNVLAAAAKKITCGHNLKNWPQKNNKRFTISEELKQYQPGDYKPNCKQAHLIRASVDLKQFQPHLVRTIEDAK